MNPPWWEINLRYVQLFGIGAYNAPYEIGEYMLVSCDSMPL